MERQTEMEQNLVPTLWGEIIINYIDSNQCKSITMAFFDTSSAAAIWTYSTLLQ